MVLRYQEQLGAEIRRRREELGLTQKNVAEAAHVVESQTVSRWERGINMPSDLEAVAGALQTTVGELMAGIQPPARVARKLDISPAEEDGSQLERIESELTRQGAILDALAVALETELGDRVAAAAKLARQPVRGTRRAKGPRPQG